MKKWIALLLALVMCLSLCACGSGDSNGKTYFAIIPENSHIGHFIKLNDGKIVFQEDAGWGWKGINTEPNTLASGTYTIQDDELVINWEDEPTDDYVDIKYDKMTDSFSYTYEGISEDYYFELGRVSKTDQNNHKNSEIIKAAEDVVMENKITASPAVTQFCKDKECVVICYGGNTWAVKGYVDTQSETGQSVRYDWFVRFSYNSSGEAYDTRVWLAD